MIIQEDVKNLFEREPIISFATADRQGNPNVVPVFWKKICENRKILLIDNFFKMTLQNILDNPLVCIGFWDTQSQESYKIKGTAAYCSEGPVYEEGKRFIQSKKPEASPKGVVEVTVTEIYTTRPGPNAGDKIA